MRFINPPLRAAYKQPLSLLYIKFLHCQHTPVKRDRKLPAFSYIPFILAHRNCSDFCDCDAHRGPQKSQRFPRQEKAMLHCDLRVRWKVASDLRFRAAISEPKTPSFCGISGDLAPSTRKSLAIAIVRFWCAKTQMIADKFNFLWSKIQSYSPMPNIRRCSEKLPHGTASGGTS